MPIRSLPITGWNAWRTQQGLDVNLYDISGKLAHTRFISDLEWSYVQNNMPWFICSAIRGDNLPPRLLRPLFPNVRW